MPAALRTVAARLADRPTVSFAEQEAVAAVARDIAEAAMLAAGGPSASSSPPFAGVDHALLNGNLARAVTLLGEAAGWRPESELGRRARSALAGHGSDSRSSVNG